MYSRSAANRSDDNYYVARCCTTWITTSPKVQCKCGKTAKTHVAHFPAPPVCTVRWSATDWLRYVESHYHG